MQFNDHRKLKGQHSFLSPSQYAWLNYSEEKLEQRWISSQAAEYGTKLHEYAAQAIELGIPQKATEQTLNMYINDAIKLRMTPEQTLYFSEYCYGTADAISFRNEKKIGEILRIHDLKTGETPAKMEQLRIYAALFCLEYGIKPGEILMELRIYQSGIINIEESTPEDILPIMDKIQKFDKILQRLNGG